MENQFATLTQFHGGVFLWIYLGALGACLGSFLNVVIYRLPLDKSIVRPGSTCPRCNNPIRWFDNIPLISYAVLRGKCRRCGEPISIRYPAVEAAAMGLVLLSYFLFGLTWHALTVAVLSLGMLAVALIDFDHMIIPDELSIGGTVVGLAASFLPEGIGQVYAIADALIGAPDSRPLFSFDPVNAVVGAVAGSASLFLIRWGHMRLSGIEGMGLGDVKLAAAIGAFVGWRGLPLVFFASAISGLIVAGGYILIKSKDKRTPIPFGTFLAMGTVVYAMGESFWLKILTPPVVF